MVKQLTPKEVFTRYNTISTYESTHKSLFDEQCKENRKFYFGVQWTDDEKTALEDRGQYDIVINKVRRATKGIIGMVSGSLPKYKAVPVNQDDSKTSVLANKLLDWCWNNSDGIHGFRNVIKLAVIDNIAAFHVIKDKHGKIKFVPLTFEEFVVDPKAKDPMFRDADCIIIPRYLDVDLAKTLYNIDAMIYEYPTEWDTNEIDSSTQVFLGRIFSSDKTSVKVYECYRKTYERDENGEMATRIVKEVLVGYQKGISETLPPEITEYPIIPVYAEHTGNPYCVGEVEFMRPLQRFINKAFGTALYNAQATSNPKVFIRENDVPNGDIDEFNDNYAVPGSVNVIRQGGEAPLVVQGQPLNNAFFTMYMDAKEEFAAATVPPQLLGFDQGGQYKSDMLDIREGVMTSLKDLMGTVELACRILGDVFLQYCKAYLKEETALVIVNGEDKVERFMVNQRHGLDITNEQSIQQFIQQQQKQGLSDEEIQFVLAQAQEDQEFAESLNYIVNDVGDMDLILRVVEGSFAPNYEMAMLKLMTEMYDKGLVDNKPVIERLPIENKDELVQRYDRITQLQGQIESQEDEIKRLTTLLQGREKELTDAMIDGKVSAEQLKLRRMQDEQKLKQLRDKYSNRLLTKEMMLNLKDELREIAANEKIKAANSNPGGTIDVIDAILR